MTELSLTVERTIAAPHEQVFDAWLDPAMLARFMLPGEGMSVPTAETDPRVGGSFRIVMEAGGNEMPHTGTYLEIDPHVRIVFTWKGPYTDEDSTVTLTFDAVDGGTRVTLHHLKFPNRESRDNHEGGWARILGALESALD